MPADIITLNIHADHPVITFNFNLEFNEMSAGNLADGINTYVYISNVFKLMPNYYRNYWQIIYIEVNYRQNINLLMTYKQGQYIV